MKATIITQPTTEPPPVTIQITASPLQFAVLAEILARVRCSDLPGVYSDWVGLYKVFTEPAGDSVLLVDAEEIVNKASGQHPS